MMKFPLLKMLHYRVIVGKLLSTIQMTEVSKLFLQKNTSMVRSSFRSGYTSKSSHTFGPDFCSFYSKFCLNRHLYKSDYNYKLKTEMSVAVRSKERWQILWLGQNWMYFYLSQLWFTVQFVFMIHFFLVLPDTSFVVSAKKVLESGIACAYLFFFFAEKLSGLRSFARRGRAMGTVYHSRWKHTSASCSYSEVLARMPC